MGNTILKRWSWMLVGGMACGLCHAAEPLTRMVTYQGELHQNGQSVDAGCDWRFRLYDATSSGNLIGLEVLKNDVEVADGRFTVLLDFGPVAFDGDRRWLEIDVLCPPDPDFTTLGPRQEFTAAPYALQTRGIISDENGNVGIGASDPGVYRLKIKESSSTSGSGWQIENASGSASLQAWVGNGAAVIDAEGPTNLHLRTDGLNRLFIDRNGEVGIDTTDPKGLLHIQGTETEQLALYGVDSVPILHFRRTGNMADWILKHDTSKFHFQTEGGPGFEILTLQSNGIVGIGTVFPAQPLDVSGDVEIGGRVEGVTDGVSEVLNIRGQSGDWRLGVQKKTTESATDFFIGLSTTADGTFHVQ